MKGKSSGPRQTVETTAGIGSGDAARLAPLVYDELRLIAARYLRRERRDHTLQPTALVHEAYLKMVDQTRVDWRGKTHFMAVAATQMRRILVDHARAAGARKRGGGERRVTLTDNVAGAPALSLEFLALDEALCRLSERNERQERVAEMRLFAGLQMNEIALTIGVSERTVKNDWRAARAWLTKELSPGVPHP